ncbi:MAG: acyl-CoA dehydratase activase [bacterium]
MFAGVDIGSLVTKAVVLGDNKIVGYAIVNSRIEPGKAGEQALEQAIIKSGCSSKDIEYIVATGYGRNSFSIANKSITELTCHATGAHYLNPKIRTVIDIGGQDSKVIKLDENGKMVDFAMNDKCAAGTGRFLEVMANALEVKLEDMGKVSLGANKPCLLSTTCTVFAETEVISLIASGAGKENIIAGLSESVARRVGSMAKSLGVQEKVVFVGGVAKNTGVKKALEEYLGIKFVVNSIDPQINGALGAAILAAEMKEIKPTKPPVLSLNSTNVKLPL